MKTPFKLPIWVSDGSVLVANDHELICDTEAATARELAYIVKCVNDAGKLRAKLKRATDALKEIANKTATPCGGNDGMYEEYQDCRATAKHALLELKETK